MFFLRNTGVLLDAAHPQLHSHATHGNEIKKTGVSASHKQVARGLILFFHTRSRIISPVFLLSGSHAAHGNQTAHIKLFLFWIKATILLRRLLMIRQCQ
jgi:hypothetical protein